MGGFDKRAAVRRFGLAAGLTPVVVIAVGQHDPAASLTGTFAERERAPRARRPVTDLPLPTPVAA